MADLQVEYAVLDGARMSLHRIAGELEGADARRDLIQDVRELEAKLTAVADTFRGVVLSVTLADEV